METTKGSQSEDESESEEEEEEEEEEEGAEGDEEGEDSKVGVSERAEVEGGVEDVGASAGSNVEESEHEDEEPDGSAKLWQADSEEANKIEASRASESRERPGSVSPSSSVGQLASKVESTLSVKASKEQGQEIRDKAANEAYKQRAREKQKYHSRRGAERIGRAKGSKAKQDNRVKLDKGGLWD
jgi:RIO kinase 2